MKYLLYCLLTINLYSPINNPPLLDVYPTDVAGIIRYRVNCETWPAGAKVITFIKDCDGNTTATDEWTPCPYPYHHVQGDHPCIFKYNIIIPLGDGGWKVIENGVVPCGCG